MFLDGIGKLCRLPAGAAQTGSHWAEPCMICRGIGWMCDHPDKPYKDALGCACREGTTTAPRPHTNQVIVIGEER